MSVDFTDRSIVHCGDSLEFLKTIPDCSVDAVVTDPPYGLSFMGKKWDYDVPSVELWAECLRVLKPGGHLLAFAGTRTQHRMAVRIEDAGFEIRDMIAWVYGSGFPKSLDVSKAIDKAAGAEREVIGSSPFAGRVGSGRNRDYSFNVTVSDTADGRAITAPATDAARHWQGWGTALKPALEPITVARKPLDGTVAANVLRWRTGAVNVDGCRVDASEGRPLIESKADASLNAFGNGLNGSRNAGTTTLGRWPANLIHDGSEEVLAGFPGEDHGSASRFFYCAKASKRDRDEGLQSLQTREVHRFGAGLGEGKDPEAPALNKNFHPTVKPTDLMRYLCRLVTPPGGVVLDPFMGSGSTGKAAMLEGFRFIGIDREAEYVEIAKARIAAVRPLTFAAE